MLKKKKKSDLQEQKNNSPCQKSFELFKNNLSSHNNKKKNPIKDDKYFSTINHLTFFFSNYITAIP